MDTQIADWKGRSDRINPVSSFRWCAQQEFIQLRSCQVDNTVRCSKKLPPPKAPPSSPYRFDYSRYDFDIVTVEVL